MAVAALSAFLVACGGSAKLSTSETKASTAEVASWLRGASVDFQPHASPSALAQTAEVTLVGTVASVDDGRVFGVGPTRDEEPHFFNATMAVRVDRVLAGDKQVTSGQTVFVELPRSKAMTITDLKRATPTGQKVLLFLSDYTAGMRSFPLVEKAPTIPGGAKIYAPYADGMLLVDHESGALVSGRVDLDELPAAWHRGTSSLKEFLTTHFAAS